jgi:hypothetical protein
MMFRSRLLDLKFGPGEESLEVELFREEDVPWDQLAFPTIEHTLRLFFEDRRRAEFGVHIGDISPNWHDKRFVRRRARDEG